MSVTSKPVTTVDDMKARVAACLTSLMSIQTRLENGVSAGPAEAQTARLVGFGIAKQAGELFKPLNDTCQYLSTPARTASPAGEGEVKAPLDKVMDIAEQIGEKDEKELTGSLVEVAQEVLESLMNQMGVAKEAVAPFLFETNAYMLGIVEDMVATATAKLDEADALTAAATPAA
ncbi:MAG: hypothetical protein IT342_12805 [Candidatus Melainabacteria bacterium]|nr:hypothetical protein [Candidatus Melainabacteria bacterium]